MTDDITIDDHITIKDRGDDRRVPDSGMSLYVKDGKLHGVDSDGTYSLPINSVHTEVAGVTDELTLEEPNSSRGTGGDIQDALNNVGAGGAVRLPAGEWQISSPIAMPDDTVLVGAGRKQTVLKQVDGANISGAIIESEDVGSSHPVVYQGDIMDLKIHGNKSNNNSGFGIQGNFWDHAIANVEVLKCPDIGINLIDPDDTGAEAVDHLLYGNIIHKNGGSGIDMFNATDGLFTANKIYSNGAYGFSAKVAWNQKLIGNHFYTNNFGSINMDRQKWCFIVGNRMNGSAGASQQIVFDSDSGVNCSQNLVGYNWLNNASIGVKLASASSSDFCENNWIGPNYYGTDTAIESDPNNEDNEFYGFLGSPTTYVADEGVRETIDGWGTNSGDPNTTGDWNGNGKAGDAVVDTTNNTKYVYRGGAWV